MKDFRFTDETSGPARDGVAQLLVQPRLWIPDGDYPGHMEWREKALDELGEKKLAIIAFWGGEPVGSVVYQAHPTDPDQVEIRNITVEQKARGRHVASFLLEQAVQEAAVQFPQATQIVGDTKRANTELIQFVQGRGFRPVAVLPLPSTYGYNGQLDVVFSRPLPVAA